MGATAWILPVLQLTRSARGGADTGLAGVEQYTGTVSSPRGTIAMLILVLVSLACLGIDSSVSSDSSLLSSSPDEEEEEEEEEEEDCRCWEAAISMLNYPENSLTNFFSEIAV